MSPCTGGSDGNNNTESFNASRVNATGPAYHDGRNSDRLTLAMDAQVCAERQHIQQEGEWLLPCACFNHIS